MARHPRPPDHDEWEWADVLHVGDGWQAEVHVVAQGGVPVVRSLAIDPASDDVPPGGVTGRLLRELPMSEIARRVAFDFSFVAEGLGADFVERLGFDPLTSPKRPGRAGHSIDHYLDVALIYVEALKHGRPQKAVAKRFGCSLGTAAQKIHDARTRGLLTEPARNGVAGGELTPKALALLERRKESR